MIHGGPSSLVWFYTSTKRKANMNFKKTRPTPLQITSDFFVQNSCEKLASSPTKKQIRTKWLHVTKISQIWSTTCFRMAGPQPFRKLRNAFHNFSSNLQPQQTHIRLYEHTLVMLRFFFSLFQIKYNPINCVTFSSFRHIKLIILC